MEEWRLLLLWHAPQEVPRMIVPWLKGTDPLKGLPWKILSFWSRYYSLLVFWLGEVGASMLCS